MPTHRTPPTPIRRHLSRQHTNTVAANAVISQAFFPGMGWSNLTHLPLPTRSAICVLRDRGATMLAVSYAKPHTRNRVTADFTVAECLVAS
jgi:hypothetical protein